MTDQGLDLAAEILRATGRVAMTVAELAGTVTGPRPGPDRRGLAGDVDLARRFREDERFVVLEAGAEVPGLDAWSATDRSAYATALRQLQLTAPQLVLLHPLETGPAGSRTVGLLLQQSLIELVDLPDAPRLATAADQAGAAFARLSPDPP